MEIIKHYRNNDALRASFNRLAVRTFGIDFEAWYQRGFWTDRYDPYSVIENGQVIANVSVNHMELSMLGRQQKLVQLGTVMTDEAYRNRGLIRRLMEEIQTEYGCLDGMFLFANDSVLDFYPKFGFRRAKEHIWTKKICCANACSMERISMETPAQWQRLRQAMEQNVFACGCRMENNPGLPFFYIFAEYPDGVYYSKALGVWAIAQKEGQTLQLLDVYASEPVSLDAVISAFGGGFTQVELGFAPAEPDCWEHRQLREENSTFFVSGALFDSFQENCLRIPVLGRA